MSAHYALTWAMRSWAPERWTRPSTTCDTPHCSRPPIRVSTYYLALSYDESGDADNAEQTLAQLTAMAPDHHDALAPSVHIQMARGRIDEAKRTLASLLAMHPASAEGFWLQGQFEMLNFDAAKALTPNDPHTLIALGQANLMLQRATAAQHALTRALQLDPKEPMAHIGRADGYPCSKTA